MTTQLAAVSPSELVTAQKGVLDRCVVRINRLATDLVEAETLLEQARKGCWATKPFRSRVYRIKRKIAYYKKIGEAVRRGYLIIPDVWGSELFAIRVKDKDTVRWSKYGSPNIQKLPVGVGSYVDAKPIEHRHDVKRDDKWVNEIYGYSADDEIEFPVTVVHPAVMEASRIAMADKVFDTLKIARQGGDPFILGEIINPNGYGRDITFFVAWFLDVERI